jgi:sterol desaturase/sphingolipid hydroxylase (fatty acid hydroxylase superfamily)
VLAEATGYWQHRASHRVKFLWRFHALHHSGARLNLVRAGRFHFVDMAAGTFLVFFPLALLGAPETIVTWAAALSGTLGIIEHSNIRMRTPAWLDRVVCTPAIHRHHHSREFAENDRNFGTSIMLFDHLFGTYAPPAPDGPRAMGIENDPVPRGFWQQTVKPFTG